MLAQHSGQLTMILKGIHPIHTVGWTEEERTFHVVYNNNTYHTLKVAVKCLHNIVNKLQYTELILERGRERERERERERDGGGGETTWLNMVKKSLLTSELSTPIMK